jgi:hypothetical protein
MHLAFTDWRRRALVAALAVSGALLVARAALGPLAFPIPVRSPLVVEGVFALAATLLFLRSGTKPEAPADAKSRVGVRLGMVLALTGGCLAVSLWFPLVCDEYVLAARGFGMNATAAAGEFTRAGVDRFFRPVADLSLWLDARWASGVEPPGWHILSLLLHLANTALVFVLARRLFGSSGVAFWSAALFGLHGSRPEAVSFLARFDQLATLFVLAGLILFDSRRWIWTGAALLAALLSKESAYVFPLLAVWMMAWRGRWDRAHLRVARALFALTAAMFLYRWRVLGGIGGYVDHTTGQPHILHIRPVALLKALTLRLWGLLYFPINWSDGPEWWLAAAMALAVGAWLYLALRPQNSQRRLLLAVAFTLIASLPVAHMLLIGADLRGAAHFYLPSVGFCLLLGALVQNRPAAGAAILAFEIAAMVHNLRIWDRTAHQAVAVCRAVSAEAWRSPRPPLFLDPPRIVDGIAFFAVGLPECVSFYAPGKPVVVAFGDDAPQMPAGTPMFTWNDRTRRFEPGRPR